MKNYSPAPSQPNSAAVTPAMISSTSTPPLPLVSNCGHCSRANSPNATLTPLTTSSTLTTPSPLQSPGHEAWGVAIRVGVNVGADRSSVGVAVAVGVGVGIDSVASGVALTVGVAVAVG